MIEQEASDDVDIEQALETQRLKLLRILAGLAVMLGLVSLAPAVSMLPQWARSYAAFVLVRAEAAVQNLVIAAACVLLRKRAAGSPTNLSFSPSPLPVAALPDSELTVDALLKRIKGLRAVLGNLRRHAKRMIARLMKPKSEQREPSPDWTSTVGISVPAEAPFAARIERPPDKRRRTIPMTKKFALS